MKQPLYPAFLCAALAVGFIYIALNTDTRWREFCVAMAVVCGVFSLFYLISHLADKLPSIITAWASYQERKLHPEVALAAAYSRMSPEQMFHLEHATGQTILDADRNEVRLRWGGVELPEDWLRSYLHRATVFYPDFAAVRKQANGSTEQLRQQTIIEYCVRRGWAQKRPGQSTIWINDWTPDRVLEHLGIGEKE